MKVYFAAPLFSRAERDFNVSLVILLRSEGFEVLLPQEFTSSIAKDDHFFKSAFDICIAMIEESDVMVAIVDGADADSGTCFEIGYAYAKRIPIVAVRTDFRASEEEGVNLMLSQSANILVRALDITVAHLATKIADQIRKTQKKAAVVQLSVCN